MDPHGDVLTAVQRAETLMVAALCVTQHHNPRAGEFLWQRAMWASEGPWIYRPTLARRAERGAEAQHRGGDPMRRYCPICRRVRTSLTVAVPAGLIRVCPVCHPVVKTRP